MSLLLIWRQFSGRCAAIAFAAALAGAAPASGRSEDCAGMKQVPFSGGKAGQASWTILRGESGFCLQAGQLEVPLHDVVPLSAERLDGAHLIFGRRRISNHLAVMSAAETGALTPVEMTFDQTSKLHLEGTFVLAGTAYLLAYDVAYSLPSGRRRAVPKEVHALYRIERTEEGSRLALVDEEFLKAGIEAGVQISARPGHTWLCVSAVCQKLTVGQGNQIDRKPELQLLSDGKQLEVLELASDDSGQASALAALSHDDRTAEMPPPGASVYFVCHLDISASCQGLSPSEIPYRLRIESGKPKWDVARNAADAADLLAFDLPRAGLNGVGNLGENNLEGRLAWSQAYYLNGLLSMIEQADDLGLAEEFTAKLRQRFAAECEELSLLTEQAYPGFTVKRYSLDREPLTSLLHLGRIMKPVWRGASLLPPETIAKFEAVERQFVQAEGANEVFIPPAADRPAQARMRKFIPFWSDGADLPWNLRSAWIEGIAWAPQRQESAVATARSLAEGFLDAVMTGFPEKWAYAAGNTVTGWSAAENVSSNTPTYGGDPSNPNGAHISYRSMDALAVLAAGRTGLISEDPAVTHHLAALVSRGLLYPFVNEEFAKRGAKVEVPLSSGRLHARVKLPWQVQNQPWALLSLPRN